MEEKEKLRLHEQQVEAKRLEELREIEMLKEKERLLMEKKITFTWYQDRSRSEKTNGIRSTNKSM